MTNKPNCQQICETLKGCESIYIYTCTCIPLVYYEGSLYRSLVRINPTESVLCRPAGIMLKYVDVNGTASLFFWACNSCYADVICLEMSVLLKTTKSSPGTPTTYVHNYMIIGTEQYEWGSSILRRSIGGAQVNYVYKYSLRPVVEWLRLSAVI